MAGKFTGLRGVHFGGDFASNIFLNGFVYNIQWV